MNRKQMFESLIEARTACRDSYVFELLSNIISYLNNKVIIDKEHLQRYIKKNIVKEQCKHDNWTTSEIYTTTKYKFQITAQTEFLDSEIMINYGLAENDILNEIAHNFTYQIINRFDELEK